MPEHDLAKLSRDYSAAAEAERQSAALRLQKLDEYKAQLGATENLGLLASFRFSRVGAWDRRAGTPVHQFDLGYSARAEEVPVAVRKVGETAVFLSAASDDGSRYVTTTVEVKYEDLEIHRLLQ